MLQLCEPPSPVLERADRDARSPPSPLGLRGVDRQVRGWAGGGRRVPAFAMSGGGVPPQAGPEQGGEEGPPLTAEQLVAKLMRERHQRWRAALGPAGDPMLMAFMDPPDEK